MKSQKGIALILAIGILAVLAVIATSFALNMRLEYKAAVNYYNGVKARYLAEAALQRAIAGLKDDAKSSAFEWTSGYTETISSTATSTIVDEQSKVNINTANDRLLPNLFSELNVSGLYNKIDNSTHTLPNRGYNNLQELKSIAGLTEEEFNAITEYVTVTSYIDNDPTTGANTGRAPININTCKDEVLKAVIKNLNDGTASLDESTESTKINTIVQNLKDNRPITSWSAFNSVIDHLAPPYATIIEPGEVTLIKNNCNPNTSSAATPSTNTTEFCFHSGGYYTITATGTVDGAKKTLTAIVKIYDIYTETTATDFSAGNAEHVTWDEDCPINSGYIFSGSYSPSAAKETRKGAVKLGYWAKNNTELTTQPPSGTWGKFHLRAEVDTSGADANFQDGGHIEFWGSGYQHPHFLIAHKANEEIKGDVACRKYINQSGYGNFVQAIEHQTGYDVDDITFTAPDGLRYVPYPYPSPALWVWPNSLNTSYPSGWNNASSQPKQYCWQLNLGVTERIIEINASADSPTVNFDVYEKTGSPTSDSHTFTYTGASTPEGRSGPINLSGSQATWSEVRIIPETGASYTSRTIVIPSSNFQWGAITATLTQTTDTAADQGDMYLQIRDSNSAQPFSTDFAAVPGDVNTKSLTYLDLKGKTLHVPGKSAKSDVIHIPLGSDTMFLQYKVFLRANDSDLEEIPIFEDVTITYLPKTEIKSYSFSSP